MVTSPLPSVFGGPAFQPHHVVLLDLEFDGVLDGHDALVGGQEGGQHVEQRGLAGAGAAGDDDVQLGLDAGVEQFGHFRGQRAEVDEVPDRQRHLAELTDGQRGTADGQRRNHGVDAGAVLQPRVHEGRRFVDAPAHLGDDALNDLAQVVLGAEPGFGQGELAVAFHIDLVHPVHHDFGDGRIVEEPLQRTVAQARRRRRRGPAGSARRRSAGPARRR